MKARVLDVPIPQGRVLALSDVHGHFDYLRGALEKARFSSGDTLVIVGDLLEKGPESLKTLREVMRLAQEHTVYWIQGNCDPMTDEFTPECYEAVARWTGMSRQRLFRDMMEEAGMGLDALEDMDAFRQRMFSRFEKEFDFMRGLPHILTMGRYLFVHGGITHAPLEEQDARTCMKNDHYMTRGFSFDRPVVVGHWPTPLYSRVGQCCAPVWDKQRHIISIDGGCVLRDAGQLNVMIIPDAGKEEFSFDAYDGLETFTAMWDQEERLPRENMSYVSGTVEMLERGEYWCTVRTRDDGRIIKAPVQTLYESDGGWRLDYTDYALAVRAGDTLKCVYALPEGIYAKDACSRVGWYWKKA